MNRLTLVPANGRDYKSQKAVQADFNAEKDFIIQDISSRWDGKPANKSSLKSSGVTCVHIRYSRLMRVAVINL